MGNSNSAVQEGRDQYLLNDNNNIVNHSDQDVHLTIGQPAMKNTMAIKNPFLLKKETLTIERDSTQRNHYYLKFTYDSLIDFNMNIILRGKAVKNDKETLYKSTLNEEILKPIYPDTDINVIEYKYNTITCKKGFDVVFNDSSCKIDMSIFAMNEHFPEADYDLIIEFLPLDFPSSDPLGFYTLCSVSQEKITEINRVYKLKVDSQRLRAQGMVMEINELFLAHRDQGECLICYEKLANTVLLPCRHSCCSGCAHGLRLRNLPCPMCKNRKYYYNL